MITKIECIAPTGDICGEAVTWSAAHNGLYWVDINRFLVHFHDLENKTSRSWEFEEPVVALSLTTDDDTILVALASKIVLWNAKSDRRHVFIDMSKELAGSRLNDGRTDPTGNFWIGSMHNNVGPNGENLPPEAGAGKLYKITPAGQVSIHEEGIGISNTVCWSPDETKFYFGDTLTQEIRVFDYDKENATVSNPRKYYQNTDDGYPDGSSMDSEGHLWNCRFAGGCIIRVDPDGKETSRIEMPVANVTTCTFGGPDLKTLFVTTATVLKKDEDRLAGSLFAIQLPVAGLPERKFKLV